MIIQKETEKSNSGISRAYVVVHVIIFQYHAVLSSPRQTNPIGSNDRTDFIAVLHSSIDYIMLECRGEQLRTLASTSTSIILHSSATNEKKLFNLFNN